MTRGEPGLHYGWVLNSRAVKNGLIDVRKYVEYTEERINISNAIIYYDMINKSGEDFTNMAEDNADEHKTALSPQDEDTRDPMLAC